jgi:hypothetical protein
VNATPDPLQRRKTQTIAAAFGIHLVLGAALVSLYPGMADPAAAESAVAQIRSSPLNILYQIAALAVCFAWLHFDARQLDIRRPWWLNVGIVLFSSVFVPYYLYKTRPPGRRAPAIFGFFGIVFGCVVAMMIGMMLAFSLYAPSEGSARSISLSPPCHAPTFT